MIYETLAYILMYTIDMISAIVFWKIKPNLFNAAETNQHFKTLLNKFSIPKAMLTYTACVALEYLIIVFIAILLTSKIVIGNWDFLFAIRFTFVFMTFVHFLGMLTNLASLMKDEITPVEMIKDKKEVLKNGK